MVIQDVLSCMSSLIACDDRFNRFLLSLHFQFGTVAPLFGSLYTLLSRFCSCLSALFLAMASSEFMMLPMEIQGLQVIVLGHPERMAMKITLVASQQKEITLKLLPCP